MVHFSSIVPLHWLLCLSSYLRLGSWLSVIATVPKGAPCSSRRDPNSGLSAVLRFHLLSFPSGSVIRFRLRSFRLSSAERLLHFWAWTFSSVLTYPVSPAFEHLFSASGRALTLKPLFFAWLLPLPIELVSCRLYLPLSPLWLGLTAFLTSRSWSPSRSRFGCWTHTCSFPRSFLVQSLADFAAGLVADLLLCPVRALRLFLLRSRSLSLGRHRLFVSPRRPSRAMLMNTVSFFLGEVFSA